MFKVVRRIGSVALVVVNIENYNGKHDRESPHSSRDSSRSASRSPKRKHKIKHSALAPRAHREVDDGHYAVHGHEGRLRSALRSTRALRERVDRGEVDVP